MSQETPGSSSSSSARPASNNFFTPDYDYHFRLAVYCNNADFRKTIFPNQFYAEDFSDTLKYDFSVYNSQTSTHETIKKITIQVLIKNGSHEKAIDHPPATNGVHGALIYLDTTKTLDELKQTLETTVKWDLCGFQENNRPIFIAGIPRSTLAELTTENKNNLIRLANHHSVTFIENFLEAPKSAVVQIFHQQFPKMKIIENPEKEIPEVKPTTDNTPEACRIM